MINAMPMIYWMLLCLATAHAALAGEPAIPDFAATYQLQRGSLTLGETVRSLKAEGDGGAYAFESEIHSTGFAAIFLKDKVIERSMFKLQDQRVIPLEYLYDRRGGKKERQTHQKFDWENRQVTDLQDPQAAAVAVPEATLDKHVYQIQVMLDLAAGKRDLEYAILDRAKVKTYRVEIIGEETLDTKLGKLDTVIVQRKKDGVATTLWCAKELYFLPVQIAQVEKDGSSYKARIKALTGMTVPKKQ
ncbi:MAG: DUF3108 domain-containing protein [Pseudomonadota bacterium]